MSDPGRLQPGDPLGGAPSPERPAGYTTPAPPGAGGHAAPARPAGEAVLGRYALAGWWPRVGAQLIDGIIVGVGGAVLLIAITAPFSIGFFADKDVGVASVVVGL